MGVVSGTSVCACQVVMMESEAYESCGNAGGENTSEL